MALSVTCWPVETFPGHHDSSGCHGSCQSAAPLDRRRTARQINPKRVAQRVIEKRPSRTERRPARVSSRDLRVRLVHDAGRAARLGRRRPRQPRGDPVDALDSRLLGCPRVGRHGDRRPASHGHWRGDIHCRFPAAPPPAEPTGLLLESTHWCGVWPACTECRRR